MMSGSDKDRRFGCLSVNLRSIDEVFNARIFEHAHFGCSGGLHITNHEMNVHRNEGIIMI